MGRKKKESQEGCYDVLRVEKSIGGNHGGGKSRTLVEERHPEGVWEKGDLPFGRVQKTRGTRVKGGCERGVKETDLPKKGVYIERRGHAKIRGSKVTTASARGSGKGGKERALYSDVVRGSAGGAEGWVCVGRRIPREELTERCSLVSFQPHVRSESKCWSSEKNNTGSSGVRLQEERTNDESESAAW